MAEQTARNVPKIRFKGHGQEWEEKLLGAVGKTQSGIGFPDAEQGGKTGTPFFKVSDMSRVGNGREMLTANNYVSDAQLNRNNWTPISSVPAVIFAKVGAAIMLNRKRMVRRPFLIDNNVMAYLFDATWDTDFGKTLFDTINLPLYAQVGALPSYNGSDIESIAVLRPENHKEQTKIGKYFRELDRLIWLHQRKHGKLVALKKAMLQKMFPQDGATVPEVRFKGFKGEWGDRSWFETVDVSTDMVDPRNREYDELFHIGPGNIESFTGKIYNNVLKVKDSYLISGKFHFHKGDIIYGKINPQLAKYIVAPFEGLASADAYVLNAKNGVVQNYLYAILQTEDFYKYSISVSARTGMPKINRDELNVYSYKAPDELEQTKIGSCFRTLDGLIFQHATQLQMLQQIKSACLEKMFV